MERVAEHGGTERLDVACSRLVVADGVRSPVGKLLGREWHRDTVYGVAGRSYVTSTRADDPWISSHLDLRGESGEVLSGYGWVFPLGDGRVNIGVGYVNSFKRWHDINAARLLGDFMDGLPRDWNLPSVAELQSSKALQAWRLPMGFTAWPPWRPGVLFAGDAMGAARPVSGEILGSGSAPPIEP